MLLLVQQKPLGLGGRGELSKHWALTDVETQYVEMHYCLC